METHGYHPRDTGVPRLGDPLLQGRGTGVESLWRTLGSQVSVLPGLWSLSTTVGGRSDL